MRHSMAMLPLRIQSAVYRLVARILFGVWVAFVFAMPRWSHAAEPRQLFTNSLAPLPAHILRTMREPTARHLALTMEFQVPLRMRNFPQLLQRLARGEIISRDEMDRTYFPLRSDYLAVMRWLAAEGFAVGGDPCRLGISARGSLGRIQKSLQTKMGEVTVDGRQYHTARTHPSLPRGIAPAVLGINGLQPFLKAVRHPAIPASLTDYNPPYVVKDILGAYNAAGMGVTGSGQKIGILIDTVAAGGDLTAFWTYNNIPQSLSNVETVNVNNANLGSPTGEETMDEEWTSGIAPGATIRVYAAGSLSWTALDAALKRVINDMPGQPQMHQLSISLGLGEGYLMSNGFSSQMNTDSQYMAVIASGGISVFVSSGDGGSSPTGSGSTGGTTPMASYYSSDPSVTGVGGTSLTLDASGNVISETSWTRSGGGVSQFFSRPSWQTGTGVLSGTMRLVPDVSLVADPNTGAYVFLNGVAKQYGGTSLGTPIWAGFCALINEARSRASLGPMGVLGPRIYPYLGTANFRDITSGSNGQYNAGPGYDAVTGVGVPNMGALIQTLQQPMVTGFSPSGGPVASNVVIAGFNFANVTSVTFNGVPAAFTVNSEEQIATTVPAGATDGPIVVATPLGSGTGPANFPVTALSPPTVLQYVPGSGTAGTTVVLTGSNFTSATAVTFNGVAASFTYNSSTQLTATAPPGVTTGPVIVTNPAGSGTGVDNFYACAGSVSGTLYSTGFESAEGYPSTGSLVGKKGWTETGTGYVGIKSTFFSGQGQAGYIGTSGSSSAFWHPIGHTPEPGEIVTFSVLMEVTNGLGYLDRFRWSVNNSAGFRLFAVEFNNQTQGIGCILDNSSTYANDAGISFSRNTPFTLQVNMDFSHNRWNASLSGTTIVSGRPITTTGATLDLGDIDAVWILYGTFAGANFMAFDNYAITESIPAYAVAAAASTDAWGSVSGTGTYASGSTATLTATPGSGFAFLNWTENGTVVSTSAAYAFPVTSNRTLTANFQMSFASWTAGHFAATERLDPTVSGQLADPDSDGIPNLLEYAFASDPKTPSASVLPTAAMEGGYLTITYAVNPAASDLAYVVEVSSDLATWNSGPAYTTSPVPVPGTQTMKVSDLTPASTGRRFIRLRVIGP